MKTSNKLLLGIFLTIIILTTVVQLMVYAKFKSGDTNRFVRDKVHTMISLPIPQVRFISTRALGGCMLMPADSFRIEIPKEDAGIKYYVLNDTLKIGDSTQTVDELEHGSRNNSSVFIYLPAYMRIKGVYSSFMLWGSTDSTSAPSYSIDLEKNSDLRFLFNGISDGLIYINQLNIKGVRATIDIGNKNVYNNLNVQLNDYSRFTDNGGTIRKMTMEADSTSQILITGKNIKALK